MSAKRDTIGTPKTQRPEIRVASTIQRGYATMFDSMKECAAGCAVQDHVGNYTNSHLSQRAPAAPVSEANGNQIGTIAGHATGSRRPPAGDLTHEWRATYPESQACTACGKPSWVTHRVSLRCVTCQKGGAA